MRWSKLNKICSQFFLLSLLSAAAFAEPAQVVVTDMGNDRDLVLAGDGNDVMVYTPSLNKGKYDLYDGGRGIDTLWLRLTQKEYDDPKFRADLIRFHTSILLEGSHLSPIATGPIYHFQNFDLDARNIENVVIEHINPREKSPAYVSPYKPIQVVHPELDSLI